MWVFLSCYDILWKIAYQNLIKHYRPYTHMNNRASLSFDRLSGLAFLFIPFCCTFVGEVGSKNTRYCFPLCCSFNSHMFVFYVKMQLWLK